MSFRLLTIASVGLLAAACQPVQQTYPQSARGPAPLAPPMSTAGYSTSEQTCAEYGFSGGSAGFDRCVQRERAARSAGRVTRDYAEARLTADARGACASYGLDAGSSRFDRCVSREVDARGYRESASLPGPTHRVDQYGNRMDSDGYRVDANGYRMPRS
jgi:hypothetical protein